MSTSQANILINATAAQAVSTLNKVSSALTKMGATHAGQLARSAAAEQAAANKINAASRSVSATKAREAAKALLIERQRQEAAARTALVESNAALKSVQADQVALASKIKIAQQIGSAQNQRILAEKKAALESVKSAKLTDVANKQIAASSAAAAVKVAESKLKAATAFEAEAAAAAKSAASIAAANSRVAASSSAAAANAVAQSGKSAAAVEASAAKQVAANNRVAASNVSMSRSMTTAGSRLQWIGKQMTMTMTAPIALLGAVGVKAGLDLEKSMTRLDKVYGDGSMSAAQHSAEVAALRENMIALSNVYGIASDQVANVAADWAAAGSSGKALAEQTKLTMETMILGEMEATEATEALIAVQAQWGAVTSTTMDLQGQLSKGTSGLAQDQLSLTTILRQLNAVENETATKMSDLIRVFQKSSGIARTAGIDTGHLAAMAAALVPAAGSATEAGTALKTIMSKLFTPTKEATEILGEMGINTAEVGWTSLNASEKLGVLSDKYKTLTGTQKQQLGATLAGRYQLNKLLVLLEDVGNENGYYAKALGVLGDETRVMTIAQQELEKVLLSNPQKLKQAGVIIQNSLMKAMVPLIPVIIQVAQWFGKLASWFANLNPHIRSLAVAVLVFMAVLGPMIIMAGLFKLALGSLAPFFGVLAKAMLLPLAPLKLLSLSFLTNSFRAGILGKALKALRLAFIVFAAGAWAGHVLYRTAMIAMVAVTKAGVATNVATWAVGATWFVATTMGMWAKSNAIALAGVAKERVIQAARWLGNAAIIATGTAIALVIEAYYWIKSRLIALKGAVSVTAIFSFMWRGIHMIMKAGVAAAVAIQWAFVAAQKTWMVASWAFALAWATGDLLIRNTWARLAQLTTLKGMLGIVKVIATSAVAMIGAISWPWVIAIGVVIGLLVMFKDQIAQAIRNVIAYFKNLPAGVQQGLSPIAKIFTSIKNVALRAFNALPNGIKNALLKVVAIVRAAALKIYELFSYINPFARHSPSLVENVNNGMSVIDSRFAQSAKRAQGSIGAMHSSIKKLQQLSAPLTESNLKAEQQEVRDNASQAGVGNAIPEYDRLAASVAKGKRELDGMTGALEAQRSRVKAAEEAVKSYDNYIKQLERDLGQMKATQDDVSRALDGAKSRYDKFANAQIAGSRAAEDAIFANTMAQKKLQLQIKKMEEEAGTIESVSDAYSKLQGDIETLTAKQTELRRSGAGSDILSTYDKMIGDLKSQQAGLMSGTTDGPAAKIQALNDQLEKLKSQAETMDLEKSLKFDQLNRNIEQFKNNAEEMPYGEIMSGMDASKTSVNALQGAYDSLGYAIDGQNSRIAEATRQRDLAQRALDGENQKLEGMQKVFDALEEKIREGEQAMQDFASAAEQAVRRAEEAAEAAKNGGKNGGNGGALSPGAENFIGGADGDFETFGGTGGLGREGGLDSQVGDIEAMTAGLEGMLGNMNPFKPIQDGWNKVTGWIKTTGKDLGSGVSNAISSGFSGKEFDPVQKAAFSLDAQLKAGVISVEQYNEKMKQLGADTSLEARAERERAALAAMNAETEKSKEKFGGLAGVFQNMGMDGLAVAFDKMGGALSTAWQWVQKFWDIILKAFGPEVKGTVDALINGVGEIFAKVWPSIVDLGRELWDLMKALFPVLGVVFGYLLMVFKALWSAINGALGPVFSWLADMIRMVIDVIKNLVKIITGVINVVVGIVQTVIGLIKGIFTGDWSTLMGGLGKIFKDGFGKILSGVIGIVVDLAKGIWSTIVNGLKAVVGFVWGWVKGIIGFFTTLWDVLVGHSIVPDMIKAIIKWFLELPGKILGMVWNFIKAVIGFFLKLPMMILNALAAFVPVLLEWLGTAILWLIENGPGLLVGFLEWIGGIGLWILEKLGDLGGMLLGWAKAGWDWLVANAPSMIAGFLGWIAGIPKWIWDRLGDLGGKLGEWFGAAWNWLVENASGLMSRFWGWLKEFPENFIRGLGVIGSKLGDWLKAAWDWVVDNAPTILKNMATWLAGIPEWILGKLGDAGKMLFDYGKNMIQGLIDGAGSLLQKIGEFMLDKLPGWIKTPFKKAMGIASPSKVFAGYGVNLGEGLIEGMDSMSPQIEAASQTMADAAASADMTTAVNVVASADTSSAAGAVSSIGSQVASGGPTEASVGASVDPTNIDYAAAEAALATFTANSTATLSAFTLQVQSLFASMAASATLSFTNMNLVGQSQTSAMVTAVTSLIATMITTVTSQLNTLTGLVTTWGAAFNAAWKAVWDALMGSATNAVDHTLSEWDRMALGLSDTMEQGIRPVFDEMDLMLENMENSFARTVDNVGTTWDGIREKTAAPARFVINDVYNTGIRGAWNKFNEFLDLEELPEHTAAFARGGAVYGKGTSTSDSIQARLSRGEHVITAREVQGAGGHAAIYRQREAWRRGQVSEKQRGAVEQFAKGGPVGEEPRDPHYRQAYAPGGSIQLGNVSAEGITTPIQQAMWDAVRTAFPNVVLHSATRTVDVGSGYDYHMQGMALDVSPSPEIARWIYEMNSTNPVLELIHWPLAGWQNLKNGAPLDYGPGTNAGHMDHVHWAMNTMVDNEGKIVSMGPMGTGVNPVNYKKLVEDGINQSLDDVLEKDPKFGGGIGKWVPASIEKARTDMHDFLGPLAEKVSLRYGGNKTYGPGGNIPYNLSAGVEQWRKLATEMLIMQGQSATYVDRLLMQMNSESGGNPNAINMWDSNAAAGTPSKGLMQVIDPTFAAHRDPRLPDDIWDPAANIAASIRHTQSRYGSLDAWQGVGYDSGGILPPGFTLAHNQTGGPEAILTASQWSAMFDIATRPPLNEGDIESGVTDAITGTGNTGDQETQAIIKGMDVWSKSWTPAMYDALDANASASNGVQSAVDQSAKSTVLLSKSIGKYNDEIQALSKLLNAISASAQQSYKVTVNTATGEQTKQGNTNVRKNEKGEVIVDVEGPSFSAWAPTINAVADLLDAMPYAERNWDADNPVAGETEQERKARIAQNNMTNYAKGLWNITKDVGPPLLRHTAIIGAAAERLIQEDGTAWSQAVALIASGNQLGWFILVPLILKTLAVMLPLILAAILDIVPALIRAIVRFLTQFMPDSVYAYADMASAEAAVQEQFDDGTVAQGQGRRYPTDAMRTDDGNAPVNLYMYGDLVMPNVSDGSDANEFVDQLKLLASS